MNALKRFFSIFSKAGFYLSLPAFFVIFSLCPIVWHRENVFQQYELIAPIAGALFFIALSFLRLFGKEGSLFISAKQALILLGWCLLLNIAGNCGFSEAPWQWYIAVLCTASLLAATWGLLGSFALILWIPLAILEMGQMGMHFFYGSKINALVIAEAMEASPAEISVYAGWKNIGMFIIVVLLAAFWASCTARSLQGMQRGRLLLSGLLGFFVMGLPLQTMPPEDRSPIYLWPLNECVRLTEAVNEALRANEKIIQTAQSLPSPTREKFSSSVPLKDKGIVLVIHIGESVRSDRLGINGYSRNTTPWLSQTPTLINFPKTISAACDTCQAQICILTNARRATDDADPTMAPTTGSVLCLFDQLGFDIYTFLGNAVSEKLKYDRIIRILGKPSKVLYHSPKDPLSGIKDIRQTLAQSKRSQNLLFLINNEGSHTPFDHFDEESAVYKPIQTSFENPAGNAEGINNAYDNTIVYLDRYIQQINSLLKGRPFVYLYIGDHGEFLGQGGIWGRAYFGDTPEDYHKDMGCVVPMFWLFSPELTGLHPHFATARINMLKNTHKIVAQEHIFHTLLGLFGIQSPYYIRDLDLTQENVIPYSGVYPVGLEEIPMQQTKKTN